MIVRIHRCYDVIEAYRNCRGKDDDDNMIGTAAVVMATDR